MEAEATTRPRDSRVLGARGSFSSQVALTAVLATACWSSIGSSQDSRHEEADAGVDHQLHDGDDILDGTASDRGADDAATDSRTEAESPDDASEGDDGWPPLPAECVESHVFPVGSVGCDRGVPRCPEGLPYCCSTNRCGSLEFGARGCCTSSDCGDPTAYHCIEAIGESLPHICTRPEPEFRCPMERPFCCYNVLGAAVCADHALFAWDSCENPWVAEDGG